MLVSSAICINGHTRPVKPGKKLTTQPTHRLGVGNFSARRSHMRELGGPVRVAQAKWEWTRCSWVRTGFRSSAAQATARGPEPSARVGGGRTRFGMDNGWGMADANSPGLRSCAALPPAPFTVPRSKLRGGQAVLKLCSVPGGLWFAITHAQIENGRSELSGERARASVLPA